MSNIDVLKGRLVEIEIGRDVSLIPSIGLYTEDLAYTVRLSAPTEADITANTATIGCTSGSVINSNDVLYWFVSTSSVPPDDLDIISGVGSLVFGSDSTPSVGVNTFPVAGLSSLTSYYTYFMQYSDNGNSLILESGQWITLEAASTSGNPLYASFKTLATRLIAKWGQNATLINITDDASTDPLKPWKPAGQTDSSKIVKMAFFNETRVDQFGKIREKESLVGNGFEYALMADNDIEPTLKSVIIKADGSRWKVRYINKTYPAGDVVLYKIGIAL